MSTKNNGKFILHLLEEFFLKKDKFSKLHLRFVRSTKFGPHFPTPKTFFTYTFDFLNGNVHIYICFFFHLNLPLIFLTGFEVWFS